jgi:heme oxygenase
MSKLAATNAPPSAAAFLRASTAMSHQRLEKRLNVKVRFRELAHYRAHLERMWGFVAAIEEKLQGDAFDGALADFEARRKLPLLTRDLLALGSERESIELLPRPTTPSCAPPAAAFGCAYVLEGSTLGGRTMLPMVGEYLGFTADHGAAFLASYREHTPAMWKSFCAALEFYCSTPERRSSAAQAATATFESLGAWMSITPA